MSELEAPNPDSRRDALVAAMDGVEEAPAPVETAAPAPVEPTQDRARGEGGRFVPKDAAPAPAAPLATEAPEPAWKKPPGSWKAEKHPIWGTLSPEAQEYAFQREEEMRAGVEPLKSKAQIADQFNETAAPFLQTMNSLGIQPMQAFKELATADNLLRTLPMERRLPYAAQVLKAYGINLTMGQNGEVNAAPSDPVVYTLQNQLTNVQGALQSMQQQQEQARDQELQREVTSFAASHPHFDQLRPTMQKLLQSGMAENLDAAYEQAARLDPDISAKIAADKAVSDVAEKALVAKQAKAAAVSPRSSTPGATTAPKATDRRSMIAEGFASIEGRF